jgi:glycosyltransferase involved in cell wall biosynthesis
MLKQLLSKLEGQETEGLFDYSLVVVDNDASESARPAVESFARQSALSVSYHVEPEQNIALARNKAVENAKGDFIAFIDDDELPSINWLYELLKACQHYNVSGVLGPVVPIFVKQPPGWIIKGKFFDRPRSITGTVLSWPETRTGNVLFKRNILKPSEAAFRSKFGMAGEDIDFFRRMIERGCKFVWCDEAVVSEIVPFNRCNMRYLLTRALLRGSAFHKHPVSRTKNIFKSALAIPIYGLSLPILAMLGWHIFCLYFVKIFDHAGRILALFKLNPVTNRAHSGFL